MKKSTTAMGREHEEKVVSIFDWDNAHRSRSSGASFHDPIDITTNSLVIECECTDKDSYSLKKSFWNEVVQKQHSNKIPSLAIRFRDPVNGKHIDLSVVYTEDLAMILES